MARCTTMWLRMHGVPRIFPIAKVRRKRGADHLFAQTYRPPKIKPLTKNREAHSSERKLNGEQVSNAVVIPSFLGFAQSILHRGPRQLAPNGVVDMFDEFSGQVTQILSDVQHLLVEVYSKRLFRSIFSNLYAGNVVRRLSSTGPPTVKW
jgi:hypothetical protein